MTTALLIECTLKASLLFALAWAGTLALRRSSASARHALWTAALAAALAMPLLVTLTPALKPLPGYSFAVTAAAGAQAPAAAASVSLVMVWLLGAVLTLLVFLVAHARTALVALRAGETGGLRTSPEAISPFLWGILQPSIIWPEQARQWPEGLRRAVIAHESEHARRLDAVWLFVGQAACVVYWFLPLVWLAAQRAREESERACDDAVLRAGTTATDYAGHLLHVARETSMRASLPAVTGSTPLERRMRSILDATAERSAISRRYAAAVAFACLAIAMPLAALQQDDKIHSAKEDKTITRPKVLHKVEPTYTEAAREAKISGTVAMSVIVEKDGTASTMKIVKSLDPGLDEAAMAAVKQWKFAPGTKDGKPVRVSATIEVNFRLN